MAVNIEVGSFTSTITSSTNTINIDDVKILIIWTALCPDYNTTYVEVEFGSGWGNAPSPVPEVFAAFQTRWNDFWNAPNANSVLGNGNMIFMGGSANYSSIVRQSLNISSVTATTVVLTMNQNFNSELMKYDYLAIGGSDVSVSFGNGTSPIVVSSQNIAHGLGVTPACVILEWGETDDNTNGYGHSWGFSDGTNQGHSAVYQYGNGLGIGGATSFNPSVSKSLQRTDSAISVFKAVDGTVIARAGVDSLDSTNIVLDWTTVYGSGRPFKWLVIAGVTARVGSFNQRTSNGTTTVPTEGVIPLALIAQSWGLVTSTSIQNSIRFSHAVTEGDAVQTNRWNGTDAGGSSYASSRFLRRHLNASALYTANPATVDTVAATAIGTIEFDGLTDEFDAVWTTTDATAREWLFLAIGSESVPPTTIEMTMDGGIAFGDEEERNVFSGLYQLTLDEVHDTLVDGSALIPRIIVPIFKLALLPDEDM
jgi:hypothetical protein